MTRAACCGSRAKDLCAGFNSPSSSDDAESHCKAGLAPFSERASTPYCENAKHRRSFPYDVVCPTLSAALHCSMSNRVPVACSHWEGPQLIVFGAYSRSRLVSMSGLSSIPMVVIPVRWHRGLRDLGTGFNSIVHQSFSHAEFAPSRDSQVCGTSRSRTMYMMPTLHALI